MMRCMCIAAGLAALLAAGPGCDLAAPEATPPVCGGREGTECPWGMTCVDDPDDACDPAAGEECPGLCEPALCGGLLGLICSKGQVCVDDPSDTCDPKRGGADCIGLCVEVGPIPVVCSDAGRTFVSQDLALCQQILFICELGWVPFNDACGCGCQQQGG